MAAPEQPQRILPRRMRELGRSARVSPSPQEIHLSYPEGDPMLSIGVFDDGTLGIRMWNENGTAITLDYDTLVALIALL